MTITAEISYYPLTGDFESPVSNFLKKISGQDISIEIGRMSTVLTGNYHKIMSILTESMGELIQEYPSVFNLKISNSCQVK